MTRIVTGLFNTHDQVDLVVEHLVQEFGISRECIQVHAFDAADAAETRSPEDSDPEVSLAELRLPEDAARACDAGMRDRRILVTAVVDDTQVERILHAYRDCEAAAPAAYEVAGHRARRTLAGETGDAGDIAARAPQEYAGETGAAALPEE